MKNKCFNCNLIRRIDRLKGPMTRPFAQQSSPIFKYYIVRKDIQL